LSGYTYNSITPFFMKDDSLLIVLSKDIFDLDPKYFWVGGGRVELKLGISIDDFMRFFGKRVLVAKIT
jgi:prolyl-tRNA editing enzyme YbaK/EbsC (Cys-tRNA(Pro) deacylase)